MRPTELGEGPWARASVLQNAGFDSAVVLVVILITAIVGPCRSAAPAAFKENDTETAVTALLAWRSEHVVYCGY